MLPSNFRSFSSNIYVVTNFLLVGKTQMDLPLSTIQSETWLVHEQICEPHLNPPVGMNFHGFAPQNKEQEPEDSYEPVGSHVVRELACKPAMFQIGL